MEVTVPTTGTYSLTSESDFDTIGYLYDSSFDPSVPTANLITDDDDSGDMTLQFLMEVHLEAGHTYVLVLTTHSETTTGSFSIIAAGPDSAHLMEINPTTSQPITIRKFIYFVVH